MEKKGQMEQQLWKQNSEDYETFNWGRKMKERH